MALLLAPYNNAMQLGMGFNSFTQQLCVNDAVQKPNGVRATEQDLIEKPPVDESGQPAPGVRTHTPSSEVTPHGYPKKHGETFVRKHEDGSQADISQIVTWTSTFVNNISEVTESMDIKGSLAIKIDAIGGGAKASANYLNTDTFKKSDINYHLQVNVINQRLIGDNITEFKPIKNVQANQFKDVYGDCFISGFIEGGVFDAVISIELADKNAVKNFGGELAINAKFAGGAVEVEGSGAGQKNTSDHQRNDKITVTVSWFGGGDIITPKVEKLGWTLETLKEVAMSFADKVALCPQRTSAILTKYSSLRSFYEKNLLGSPLDYENAGVYSSALLDAYIDYKAAWKELQAMSWQVKHGLSYLKKQPEQSEMSLIRDSARKSYDERKKLYDESIAEDTKQSNTSLTRYNAPTHRPEGAKIEKPLLPNKLEPYPASIFGLELAQRDCRFEMIKIVREVDAVANDPQVAVDPTRNDQFLSPSIFRELIPFEHKVDPVAMMKEIEDLKVQLGKTEKDLQTEILNVQMVKAEKAELSTQLTTTQASLQTTTEDRNSQRKQLIAIESKNEVLTAQLEDSEQQVQTISQERDDQVSALEDTRVELTAQLNEAKATFTAQEVNIATLNSQLESKKTMDLTMPSPEEIVKMKSDLAASVQECAEKMQELDTLKMEHEASITEARMLKGDKETLEKSADEIKDAREKEVRDLRAWLQKANAEAAEALRLKEDGEKKLATAEADLQSAVARSKVYYDTSETLQSELQHTRNERDGACQDRDIARTQRDDLKVKADSVPDITIHSIVWGETQLWSQPHIYEKILQYIQNGWGFTFDNDFFCGDTKPGHRKFGSIAYTYKFRKTDIRSGWEGECAQF